jgi:hypothetical protein
MRRAGMARRLVPLLVIASFALLVFAFAGCGGDDNGASGDTTTTETTTTEDTTTDTETTETETTTTEDEDTDTTETSALGDDFASSENCREFTQIGTRISDALTGTGGTDLDEAKAAFDELTAAAPAEIKDDFQVIADAYSKLVDALQGVDLSDPNPDPATLQKLAQASQELDQAKLTQASTNISTWAQENC